MLQALTQGRKRRDIDWTRVKLLFDGDSLMASQPPTASQRVPARVAAFPPASGLGTFASLAIGGQTTQNMIDNAADVDNAYDPSRTNILVVWAGTNGMIDGPTMQAQRMRTYIAARKAAHPELIVVLVGLIPRHEATTIPGAPDIPLKNVYNRQYNALCQANWRTWGADAYVDPCPLGGPFDLPDWTTASFTRPETLPMWSPNDAANVYTHLSATGANYIARLICAALMRL